MANILEELRAQLANGTPNVLQAAPSGGSSGFDASETPDLAYNLKPYVDAEGVVPEPSRDRYNKFAKRITKLSVEASELVEILSDGDDKKLRENPKILDALAEQSDSAEKELRAAVADLCNGSPTKKQIDALPTRVFMRFYRWLSSELNPEGLSAGTPL